MRDFIDEPYQFWIEPLVFLVLAPIVMVSDLVKGNFGWRMVVNATLVAGIGRWLVLWLRRPTKHDRQTLSIHACEVVAFIPTGRRDIR